MADAPKRDDTKSLADRLVSDPKNPPDLTMLQGWLGASSEDKHRRLYLDPELSQSLEIPNDAIVHTQDIPAEVNPLGGSWVWVKADAAIKQGPGLERLYARFLKGQIQQDFLAAAGGGGAGGAGMVGGPGPGAATNPLICPVQTVFNCPTRQVWCRPSVLTICPSQLTICPTRPIICQVITQSIQCVPSAAIQCPTRICPSAVDACPSAPGGCIDPGLFHTPVIAQQPGFAQGGFQAGLGFDPGAVAGGFVGAPATSTPACQQGPAVLAGTQFVVCHPSIIQICPTRSPICITRYPFQCRTLLTPWCPPTQTGPQCCLTQIWSCPIITHQPGCTIITQPPACPIPTQPPGCPAPSFPPGCPTGFVCVDPGGGGPVINPGFQAGGGGFDPNAGFDPSGGGMVGGAMRAYPTMFQICWTRLPICHLPTAFCPV